ncbi:MAG: hypothetical protein GXO29_07915 [Thermotogae bacterium]|nr:hypothetical protein [Thermotogota bacterium]
MRRTFVALTVVIALVGGCARDITPTVVNKDVLLQEGWALYKEGRFPESFAKFDSAILYTDPTDIEAHLGKGLALMRMGNFNDAHQEFALVYSPYVQEALQVLNLYVPDTLQDTIGGDKASPALIGMRVGLTPSAQQYPMAAWKLGPILRMNGVTFENSRYVYLPVDLIKITVDPDTGGPEAVKSIEAGTYVRAFMPATIPLSVDDLSVTYTDTVDGPIVFLAGTVTGPGEALFLTDWLVDNTDDTLRLNILTMRIDKNGLGERPDIVWMALAADAYAYYLDPANTHKRIGAYLAYTAYMLFPLRGEIPEDKPYHGIDGLSEDDEVVFNGLLGIATLGYYKDNLVGNAVTIIRFYGDSTFPAPDWTTFPTTREQMQWSVGYTRDNLYNAAVYSKANELFFQR